MAELSKDFEPWVQIDPRPELRVYTTDPNTGERCTPYVECQVCGQGLQCDHGQPLIDSSFEYLDRELICEDGGHICNRCADELDVQPEDIRTVLLVDAIAQALRWPNGGE